jgi:hypothetical protein
VNDPIFETIVTTVAPGTEGAGRGAVHIAPMGLRRFGADHVLMPFRPSTTLDNMIATGAAVVNYTTDVRVFAGCVTGRRRWPVEPARHVDGVRLAGALAHAELKLARVDDDPQRPALHFEAVHEAVHAAFTGFNRAQAAVIEGAVLVSRLHMLSPEKIATEFGYLQIAIDKTAGEPEREAWQWLQEAVAAHLGRTAAAGVAAAPGRTVDTMDAAAAGRSP